MFAVVPFLSLMFLVGDYRNKCNENNIHTQNEPSRAIPTKATFTPVLTVFSSCCCHLRMLLFIPKTYYDQFKPLKKTNTVSSVMGWRAADCKMVRSLNVQCFVTVYTSHSASVTTRMCLSAFVVLVGVPVSSRVSTKIQQLLNTLKRPKRPPLSEFFTDDSEEIVEGTLNVHLKFLFSHYNCTTSHTILQRCYF